VIPLSLAAIAKITGAAPAPGTDTAAVARTVVIDSRQAGPGALFAALPGERVDGHDFAAAAAANGAVAALASRPVGVPALLTPDVPAALGALARAVTDALPGLTIVGITGSAPCCAWGTPTPASSAGWRRWPAPRGNCPPRCRPTGSRC